MAEQSEGYQSKSAVEGQPETTRGEPVFAPVTDIYETKDGLALAVELPGADPSTIEATVDKRVLTIRARVKPTDSEGYAAQHVEYREGDFERSFTLSGALDAENIHASVKDGVLTLLLPREKKQGAVRIKVAEG